MTMAAYDHNLTHMEDEYERIQKIIGVNEWVEDENPDSLARRMAQMSGQNAKASTEACRDRGALPRLSCLAIGRRTSQRASVHAVVRRGVQGSLGTGKGGARTDQRPCR